MTPTLQHRPGSAGLVSTAVTGRGEHAASLPFVRCRTNSTLETGLLVPLSRQQSKGVGAAMNAKRTAVGKLGAGAQLSSLVTFLHTFTTLVF